MSLDRERPERLRRNLGVWSIWLLAVNGLIGAGIFGLPSGAAGLAGEYSPVVYVVCALLILPILLCFAEASSYFRGTGGPVRYSTEAFGPFIGFQTGWLYYVSTAAGLAANSVLFVDNLGFFWKEATLGAGRVLSLALIWVTLMFSNIIGSASAIRSLAVLTVGKLGVLLLLVVLGIAYLGSDLLPNIQSDVPSIGEFGAAALLLIYAFVGFESAVIPAGESRRPARDIPAALLLALAGVALLYVLIQMVSMEAVADIGTSTSPLLDVANALIGPGGASILLFGVVASVGGNLLRGTFAAPRLTYALALDGSLPQWFGTVHERFLTPVNSILFFVSLVFLLAVYGSFIWLAAAAVLSRLFMYVVICLATPRLRKTYANAQGFVLPGGYLVPVLGISACALLTLQVSRESFLATTWVVSLGSVLYLVTRGRSRPV
jgi:amino acid transporter